MNPLSYTYAVYTYYITIILILALHVYGCYFFYYVQAVLLILNVVFYIITHKTLYIIIIGFHTHTVHIHHVNKPGFQQ